MDEVMDEVTGIRGASRVSTARHVKARQGTSTYHRVSLMPARMDIDIKAASHNLVPYRVR